jgi:hypothetical protein
LNLGVSLQQLAELLASFDAGAINLFEGLQPQLATLGQRRLLDELQRDLNGFDFVAALHKLRDFADEVGVSLVETS